MTLALMLAWSACSNNEETNLQGIRLQELIGTWELAPIDSNAAMTDASIWHFSSDNTCICYVGVRGIDLIYTYQLLDHGLTVQLTASDGSVTNFITGKLSRDQIVWQEMLGSGGTRLMHKLIKVYYDKL